MSLVKKRESEPMWVSYIKRRIKNNENFVGIITGKSGSGKSWTCLSIAEMLDPEFTINNVVFTELDFYKLISSGTLKKGSVVVFEEIGVELSNKTWWSDKNRDLNITLQTFRAKNWILLVNSPESDFLDSDAKKMVHAEFRTVSKNKRNNTVRLRCEEYEYNARKKKMYYKFLQGYKPGKGSITVERWDVPKPSEKLLKLYEPIHQKYKDDLMSGAHKRALRRASESYKELTAAQNDFLKEVRALAEEGLSKKEIIEVLGKPRRTAEQMAARIHERLPDTYPIFEKGQKGGKGGFTNNKGAIS